LPTIRPEGALADTGAFSASNLLDPDFRLGAAARTHPSLSEKMGSFPNKTVPMATFDSHYNFFDFRHFVMRKARHALDESSRRFVQSVIETSRKRIGSIEKDSILWRAQLDVVWESRLMPTSLSLNPNHVAENVDVEILFSSTRREWCH
jgi:hypothetical protein